MLNFAALFAAAGQRSGNLVSLVGGSCGVSPCIPDLAIRILLTISILSFLTLAWAAFAVARHVRRGNGLKEPGPVSAGGQGDMVGPDRTRPGRYRSAQRFDRTYAHEDSGNLNDPGARAQTRPQRDPAGLDRIS